MNVQSKQKEINNTKYLEDNYEYYFAMDWSMDTTAIARMRSTSGSAKVIEMPSDLKQIKQYAKQFRGKKILAIEETTGSQWLYVELRSHFDKIIICDPYRNHLLSEGAKNDKIDAKKLCLLLRSGLLKPVYHGLEENYEIRKLVSGYLDLNKSIVRVKNQLSALYRSNGLRDRKVSKYLLKGYNRFISDNQFALLETLEEQKQLYLEEFQKLRKQNRDIDNLMSISGVNLKSAVKIYGIVIDPFRFENKYKYWSYCGLVYHIRESNKRLYGRHKGRYHRELKAVYKTAALAAISGNNDIRVYYEWLVRNGFALHDARHIIARYIAKSTYGMLKSHTKYKPYSWRKNLEELGIKL